MSQRLTGGALALIGTAPIVFEALDLIGGYDTGVEPFLPAYGVLIVLLGGGVYADEIQFDQESAGKYEGLIFLYAIVAIIGMVGSFFIALS